jgi:hypothetical protein
LAVSLLQALSAEETAPGDAEDAAENSSINKIEELTLQQGRILLFDGETFYGWRAGKGDPEEAGFVIDDGAIAFRGEESPMLRATSQFSDFHARFEIFLEDDDSWVDVYFRSPPTKDAPEDARGKVRLQKSDSLPVDDWRWVELDLWGDRYSWKASSQGGVPSWEEISVFRGYLGFVLHGGAKIRSVGLRPIPKFHRESLDDPKSRHDALLKVIMPKEKRAWKFEGEHLPQIRMSSHHTMRLFGKKGYLESKQTYGDFTLQLQARTLKPGVNSGVFFRCIPDEATNGYECQIHHDPPEADREKYIGCTTGGIFRRSPARPIDLEPEEWFTLTLHADDRHFAVWINGYQVNDWTDTREPDANPRRGLRLEPGTLQLQSHDEGTDIEFGNIFVQPLYERHSMNEE